MLTRHGVKACHPFNLRSNRSMTESRDVSAAASYTDAPLHRYPRWAMRFWHGMDFFTWMKLLVGNRFAFAPIRLSMVITVTIASLLNSFARVFQWLMFHHAIQRTKLKEPP